MNNVDLQDQLSLTLLRASLKGKYGMTHIADAHEITLQQAMTLCLLEPDNGVPMNAIGAFLTCDASTVSGVVDRLHTLQFIERKESVADRRSKLISLTETGLELRRQLLQVTAESRFPALSSLSDADIHQLIDLITKATGGVSVPAGK